MNNFVITSGRKRIRSFWRGRRTAGHAIFDPFERDKMIELGVKEMFFTSDTPSNNGDLGAVPGELQTANFRKNSDREFDALDILQPSKPYMATEFWSGWVKFLIRILINLRLIINR